MIAKLEALKVLFTKTKTSTEHPQTMGSTLNNHQHQQQNHCLRTDSSLGYREGGLNAFYWSQIFALDSVIWFWLSEVAL